MDFKNNKIVALPFPEQQIKPLQIGANNPFQSALMKQNQQKLVGGRGRGKKLTKTRIKGGSANANTNANPVIIVPSSSSLDPNPSLTNNNLIALTRLGAEVMRNSAYDGTVNGTQEQVNQIFSQQIAPFKGGNRTFKNKNKKGGFPYWNCLSGGKKSRKYTKNCRYKKRKYRKTKRRR
jgi:hypothetical protein